MVLTVDVHQTRLSILTRRRDSQLQQQQQQQQHGSIRATVPMAYFHLPTLSSIQRQEANRASGNSNSAYTPAQVVVKTPLAAAPGAFHGTLRNLLSRGGGGGGGGRGDLYRPKTASAATRNGCGRSYIGNSVDKENNAEGRNEVGVVYDDHLEDAAGLVGLTASTSTCSSTTAGSIPSDVACRQPTTTHTAEHGTHTHTARVITTTTPTTITIAPARTSITSTSSLLLSTSSSPGSSGGAQGGALPPLQSTPSPRVSLQSSLSPRTSRECSGAQAQAQSQSPRTSLQSSHWQPTASSPRSPRSPLQPLAPLDPTSLSSPRTLWQRALTGSQGLHKTPPPMLGKGAERQPTRMNLQRTATGKGRYMGDRRRTDGKPHGMGSFNGTNGVRYSGRWVNGLPQGDGVLQLSDGKVYEGSMWEGMPEGFGIAFDPYGAKFIGKWCAGRPSPSGNDGEYHLPDGSSYYGSWIDGRWSLSYGFATDLHNTRQQSNASEHVHHHLHSHGNDNLDDDEGSLTEEGDELGSALGSGEVGDDLQARLQREKSRAQRDSQSILATSVEVNGPGGRGKRLTNELPGVAAAAAGQNRSELSMHEVLENPHLRSCLVKFVRRTFQTENLYFLLRCKALQHGRLKDSSLTMGAAADEILEDFLAANAPFEINIPGNMKDELIKSITEKKEGASLLEILKPAAEEIQRILEYDVWSKFSMSDEYEDCLVLPKDAPPSGDVFALDGEMFDSSFTID